MGGRRTIRRFRQRHETALAELFSEVLALGAEACLVRVGLIAVDGTKVAANAAPQATRDYEQIAREILAEAAAAGCARPSAASTTSALRRRGRSRATGPTGCARPSAGSRKNTRSSARPT